MHVSFGNNVAACGPLVPMTVNTFKLGLCSTFPSSNSFLALDSCCHDFIEDHPDYQM